MKILQSLFKPIKEFFTPIRIIVTALVIAFFWFMVLGDNGIYQFRKLLEMRTKQLTERQNLNTRIDQLTREKQILQNPEMLEMAIRSELGYVKPGEIVFERAKPKPAEPATTTTPTPADPAAPTPTPTPTTSRLEGQQQP